MLGFSSLLATCACHYVCVSLSQSLWWLQRLGCTQLYPAFVASCDFSGLCCHRFRSSVSFSPWWLQRLGSMEMYAALSSLRGLVRLLWSLLSSLPFFCLVLSLVASAIGIDGDVRSVIQPSWPSATSLVSAVIITSVLAYLCTSAAIQSRVYYFSGCYCNCAW